MTAGSDPDEQLFGEAVNLSIRLQSPGGPEAEAAVHAWCTRSPGHERVWAEVAEIQGLTRIVLADKEPGPALSRRRLLGLALGAGALGTTGAVIGPGLATAARADHRTGKGEQREVRLADGSRLIIGPASAVGAAPRGARLLAGQLLCEIAPGTAPFRLAVGELSLRSDRATFCVSAESAGISVTLEEGALTVETPVSGRSAMAAGSWRRLDPRGTLLEQAPRPRGEAAAWTERRLVTRSETVAVLVEQIARWLPGGVVLADARLGRLRVAGTFDLGDPDAALQAVVLPHGGRLRRIAPWLRVVARA